VRGPDADWRPDPADAYCPRCGMTVHASAVTPQGCPRCRGVRLPWDRLTRLAAYKPPVSGWIIEMKFGRVWPWAPSMGRALAARVADPVDPAAVLVVPVPMHWFRRWQRGFNQAHLMAAALAEARGWRCVPVLRRTRHTPPQTHVTPSQRPANVRGSFAVADGVDLTGYEVVLVDDVTTTGSTLRPCARLLKDRGARSVQVAVAAVADPKGQDFEVV